MAHRQIIWLVQGGRENEFLVRVSTSNGDIRLVDESVSENDTVTLGRMNPLQALRLGRALIEAAEDVSHTVLDQVVNGIVKDA